MSMVIEKSDGHQRHERQTVKRLGDTVWQPGYGILEGLTRLRDQRVFSPSLRDQTCARCWVFGTFLSSIFVLQYQEGGKIFKVKKDLSYLHIRTFCQLGHGSTLKNQETLLTDDLDITAGAKEKASQLKDLDGSTW